MSMDGQVYERLRNLERQMEVLLELHPEARDRLRPPDALAICDAKGALRLGPITSTGSGWIVEAESSAPLCGKPR